MSLQAQRLQFSLICTNYSPSTNLIENIQALYSICWITLTPNPTQWKSTVLTLFSSKPVGTGCNSRSFLRLGKTKGLCVGAPSHTEGSRTIRIIRWTPRTPFWKSIGETKRKSFAAISKFVTFIFNRACTPSVQCQKWHHSGNTHANKACASIAPPSYFIWVIWGNPWGSLYIMNNKQCLNVFWKGSAKIPLLPAKHARDVNTDVFVAQKRQRNDEMMA